MELSNGSKKLKIMPVHRCLQVKSKELEEKNKRAEFEKKMLGKYPKMNKKIIEEPSFSTVKDNEVSKKV